MRSPRRSALAVAAAALLVAAVLPPARAGARVEDRFDYPYAQVWSTAIRMLRVDLGYVIRDRDESVGYVLFDYVDGDRTHPGTLEVLAGDGQGGVRVVVRVPSRPSWVARMLVDRLARKLREDYGEPAPPRAPAPPEAPAPPAEGETR